MMTSAALSSAPALSQPPATAGIAGSARPAPSAHGSRSTRTAPGFLRSVGVELLKMRRLRVLLITVLLVIASVAMSSIDLFSQSKIHSLADPAAKPWASLLLAMVLFNALTQPIFVAVLASRQTDIEHSGAGWNLASASGLTPGALCRVKLAALTLLIVPAAVIQSVALIAVARMVGLSLPLDVGPWVTYTLLLALVNTAMCAYHLWLAAVVENQLVVMSAGLLGGFIGVYMLLSPPMLARLLPWGYYAVITPAKVSMVDGHGVHEYVQVPMGWIVGFLVLTAVIFTAATRRLDRIER
ncbi:ABC transporter permease [Actinomyces naeslundii]|uniref:ABC transporter permease n=1 Tax=Actinomyces naeslundii TaxID=1655 RepID=UPI0009D745DC